MGRITISIQDYFGRADEKGLDGFRDWEIFLRSSAALSWGEIKEPLTRGFLYTSITLEAVLKWGAKHLPDESWDKLRPPVLNIDLSKRFTGAPAEDYSCVFQNEDSVLLGLFPPGTMKKSEYAEHWVVSKFIALIPDPSETPAIT